MNHLTYLFRDLFSLSFIHLFSSPPRNALPTHTKIGERRNLSRNERAELLLITTRNLQMRIAKPNYTRRKGEGGGGGELGDERVTFL